MDLSLIAATIRKAGPTTSNGVGVLNTAEEEEWMAFLASEEERQNAWEDVAEIGNHTTPLFITLYAACV